MEFNSNLTCNIVPKKVRCNIKDIIWFAYFSIETTESSMASWCYHRTDSYVSMSSFKATPPPQLRVLSGSPGCCVEKHLVSGPRRVSHGAMLQGNSAVERTALAFSLLHFQSCWLLSVVCRGVCVCVFVHYFMGELAGSHSCVCVPVHFKCAYICVCVTLHMWALAGILSCLQARVRVCTLMCAWVLVCACQLRL